MSLAHVLAWPLRQLRRLYYAWSFARTLRRLQREGEARRRAQLDQAELDRCAAIARRGVEERAQLTRKPTDPNPWFKPPAGR